jgi:predicted AAA+ superfamily ATPase
VRERKLPKLYWVDPGLVRAAKRQLGPVAAEEMGPLFEGFVLNMLRAHREQVRLYEDLAFWSPHQSSVEVDFVLRRGREFVALEAKASRHPSGSHLKGLLAIADLPGLVRRILVYAGERRLRTPEGIEVWPVSALSDALAEDRLWP